MAFLKLCSGDEIVDTLREVFGANIIRVPEERIQPLSVIAVCDKKTGFRGALENILDGSSGPGTPRTPLGTDLVLNSHMANLSGKKTTSVDVKLGLEILDGFLQGFGIPGAVVSVHFGQVSSVSFSFQEVIRKYLDIGVVGRLLSGRIVDFSNPAAAIYRPKGECDLLVVDSLICSRSFVIHADRAHNVDFHAKLPEIRRCLGAQSAVQISSATGLDLSFQGDRDLGFAFSCVRLCLDKKGKITDMPPGKEVALMFRDFRLSHKAQPHLVYSPDRVLLGKSPGMISFDE